jgi:4-hydroxy-tetrahydrodipicolinate synthase
MGLKKVSGVYAAALTPRNADDSVNVMALTKLVRFLMSKGVSAFALNGATGEFCMTTPTQLQTLVATVRAASGGKGDILCGIGAASAMQAAKLAEIARAEGASGLLVPMPYFFRYQQEDLSAFCKEVAKSTDLPVLLYNLPQFSTGLEKETVRALIAEVLNIIGIKDSGGSLEILRDLTEHGLDACRIVGNDITLRPALGEGVCDGVISGIACVLPELTLALYAQGRRAVSGEFDDAWGLLRQFMRRLEAAPTPWGLKWAAEARGIMTATFSQPMNEFRRSQGLEMMAWFREWLPSVVPRGILSL